MRRCRPLALRFWEKVDKTPGFGPWGDCWLWTAYVKPNGYGGISAGPGSEMLYAHRVAFELAYGRPPADGLNVCHRCDVRSCVNDAHFFEGTQAENLEDMTAKGRRRSVSRRGTRSPTARLTDDAVREILASSLGARPLARHFGVSRACIRMVRARTTWTHIAQEISP